jgi:integrase
MPKCLSDAAVRNAKPKSKPYKMSDGEGLFLLVTPSGGKYWRMKYFFAAKEKLLALGVYPEVSLSDARQRRIQARKVLAAGNDPGEVKKDAKRVLNEKHANTFEVIAREWHKNRLPKWSPGHAKKILTRLERHIFPRIGTRPIADLTASELLSVMRKVEEHGGEIAHRLLQVCGQIFAYAVVTDRVTTNPALSLRGALTPVVKSNHAYIKPNELPEYLKDLDAYDGALQTKFALRFLLLTFVRTGELRGAEWAEVDLKKAEWRIPAERMKMKEPHTVPLSRQAVAVLKQLQPLTGQWRYVFPNQHKPSGQMSENTILFALYRMGYHSRATGHGFRSTASTVLNEHGFPPDVIERQLAHGERDKVRAAYNHAQYLPERRKMMQWWADYLDKAASKKSRPRK